MVEGLTPCAIAWVERMLTRPSERVELILANSQPPPPSAVALALVRLASTPSLERRHAETTQGKHSAQAAVDLLRLALDTLDGKGFSHKPIEQTADIRALKATITHNLCSELIAEHSVEPALQALLRFVDTAPLDPSGENEEHERARACLLLATATVLRAAEKGPFEIAPEQRSALPAACERSALIEAQQLLAKVGEERLHTECVVRLAELMLIDPENKPPKISDLPDLIEGLTLHANRLEAARECLAEPPEALELIARHYLLTAQKANRDLTGALVCCAWLVSAYEALGDQDGRLLMVLERARILRDQGEAARALNDYEEARRGLLLSGQASPAAIATLEGLETQMEAELAGGFDLSTGLTPVFASGAIGPQSLASLLLLRESYVEGDVNPAQIRLCLEFLYQHI